MEPYFSFVFLQLGFMYLTVKLGVISNFDSRLRPILKGLEVDKMYPL